MYKIRFMRGRLYITLILIFICIIFFEKVYTARAESLSNNVVENPKYITFLMGAGEISDHVLFDTSDGLWFPGCSRNKDFYVKNLSYSSCALDSIKFDNMSLANVEDYSDVDSDVYDDFMRAMNAKLTMDGEVIFDGDFLDIERSEEILEAKCTIPSGQSKKFNFTICMDEGAGENLQDLICKFDFIVKCSAYDGNPQYKHKIKHTVEAIVTPPQPIPESSGVEPEVSQVPSETVADIEKPEPTSLPKTGSVIDMDTLIASGIFMVGLGYALTYKKL